MGGRKQVFNEMTGEWEDETRGYQNVIYQAFHGTGSFDPRMTDEDFLAGRQKHTPKRVVVALSVSSLTIERMEEMAKLTGVNRGRMVDAVIRRAYDFVMEHEKGKGNGEEREEAGADGDELDEERPPRRRRPAHD